MFGTIFEQFKIWAAWLGSILLGDMLVEAQNGITSNVKAVQDDMDILHPQIDNLVESNRALKEQVSSLKNILEMMCCNQTSIMKKIDDLVDIYEALDHRNASIMKKIDDLVYSYEALDHRKLETSVEVAMERMESKKNRPTWLPSTRSDKKRRDDGL